MKRFLLLLIIFATVTNLLAARQTSTLSEINQVTVFTEGAQVDRNTTVSLRPGIQEVVVADLPVNMDQSTIFVKPDQAKVRSIAFKVNKHEQSKNLPSTEKENSEYYPEIDLLERENSLLDVRLEVIKQELEFITSNRNVAESLKDFTEIKRMNEYYRARVDSLLIKQWKLNNQTAANNVRIKHLKKLINKQSSLNIYPSQSV
ncbi:MAG: DUF4140 domain-containing protein, partial [Bacteroidota bacterium]